MKKKLIKEILEIDKIIHQELIYREKTTNQLNDLYNEINIIEEKINNNNKILNISLLNKLQSIYLKKSNELSYIENNLPEFQKQNDLKEKELDNNLKLLIGQSNKNELLLSNKKEELLKVYEKARKHSRNSEEYEHIIIPPEMMSICLESKITNEMDFLTKIKILTNETKLTNEKIKKEIDSNVKTLVILNSKKDSSSNAELSTSVKYSSLLSKHNAFLQQIEVINNFNMNNNNEENESMSSISMELETNLNLNELPSDDESLRFIDKVFDIKSNIKPIKNNLKSIISPLTTSKIKKSSKKVEPIKIEKPINYKQKEEELNKEIDIIKKEIENKRNKIEEIKNKKKNLEKELNININNLNQALIKIKIIKDKIDFLQRQKDDLSTNNKRGQLSRLISINNIINNRNYCLIDNNDNSIYDKETLENRK
jgi:mediator of RNA polymerase II transcription subunit 21